MIVSLFVWASACEISEMEQRFCSNVLFSSVLSLFHFCAQHHHSALHVTFYYSLLCRNICETVVYPEWQRQKRAQKLRPWLQVDTHSRQLVHLFYNPLVKMRTLWTLCKPACTVDQVNKAFLCDADEGVIRPSLSLRKDQRHTHAVHVRQTSLWRTAVQMCFVSMS